jgi:PAS domain S-box-containing protein
MKAQQIELSLSSYQIIQTLLEGVAIEDSSGYLVCANPALEQLLGYEAGELAGRHWTALVPRWSRGQPKPWRVGQPAGVVDRVETQLCRKDGTEVSVLACARPLFKGDQRRGILSVFVPLDSRRHLLSKRFMSSYSLCTEQPESHRRQSAGMSLIGQHVLSVAHELNNPLTIILLQTRLLHKAVSTTSAVEDSLVTIEDQIQRMARMVDDLLVFAGKRPSRLDTTDVNTLIRQTLDLQSLIQDPRIQVSTDLSTDVPPTQADPDRLQQVFVNIINNAYQAIAAADGSDRPGRLTVTTAIVHGQNGHVPRIQIRFADNGPGISPEVMPHIFEPFFTTKRSGKGIGLGLSICDQITQEHGGRIWAENNQEGGATFVLELPVVEPAASLARY